MDKKKEIRLTGWSPMPVLLKVLFILMAIGLIFSVFSLISTYKSGYSFLVFYFTGWAALGAIFLLNMAGTIILLVAFWKRYTWAVVYTFVYFLFFIINGILAFTNIPEMITAYNITQNVPGMETFVYAGAIIGLVLGVAIDAVFLILIYIKRDYFK